ncbi:broad-complex core protein isoforms 1/2/3/4/5-like isoform X32, partial [Biomphalaria pfeifferi]
MEFYLSERGGKVLGFQGHEYIFHRKINGTVHWRCRHYRKFNCHSKMRTIDDENHEVTAEPTEHSHDSFPQKIKANVAMQMMKETMNSVGANPRNVMGTVLQEMKLSQE